MDRSESVAGPRSRAQGQACCLDRGPFGTWNGQSESGVDWVKTARASDQPSRLARLGPSATGTGAATDSEIREPKKGLGNNTFLLKFWEIFPNLPKSSQIFPNLPKSSQIFPNYSPAIWEIFLLRSSIPNGNFSLGARNIARDVHWAPL